MNESMNGGINKVELGRRIREARQQRGMTLKEMDETAGLSATHISEIERGKTSPTIGALIRIAGALGREVSYFVEPEVLPDIARSSRADRNIVEFGPAGAEVQTPGVPGGRLRAVTIHLEPGLPELELSPDEGSLGGYVLRGRVRVGGEDGEEILSEGDSLYAQLETPARFAAVDGPASLVLVTTVAIRPATSDAD